METPQISNTVLDTHYGSFEFYCFTWGPHEEDNVLVQIKRPFVQRPLVRIQSACYTAEIFRSLDCDCHEQLDSSLRLISAEGGIFIYMLADGRGAGLQAKVLGLELGRSRGLDTADAYAALGVPADPREYSRAAYVLRYFGVADVRLLTNNPRKLEGIANLGLVVTREALEISATDHSRSYLQTKKRKMGHLLNDVD
jgi:GTP cyclohydrolase II